MFVHTPYLEHPVISGPVKEKDHECLIFVSGKTLLFESFDSAVDALTLDGILLPNAGLEDKSHMSDVAIENWP
jgi:hypothetical protein